MANWTSPLVIPPTLAGASDDGKYRFIFQLLTIRVDARTCFFRVCPGRYLAFSGVWITLASLAAVFDITKAVDDEGNIIEPSHEYVNSAIM